MFVKWPSDTDLVYSDTDDITVYFLYDQSRDAKQTNSQQNLGLKKEYVLFDYAAFTKLNKYKNIYVCICTKAMERYTF